MKPSPFKLTNTLLSSAVGIIAWISSGCHSPSASSSRDPGAAKISPACCTPSNSSGQPPEQTDSELASLTSTPWRASAERQHHFPFEFRITEQTGRRINAADLAGKPFAATFLYTRCENTNKCPLVARTFGRLQGLLREQKLEEKVNLLLVTYDPEHDSPSDLARFSERHALLSQANTWLLRPDPGDKKRFFEALNVAVNFNQRDVNAHRIEIMLFDEQSRFVRSYHSLIWDNSTVVQDLLRLTKEK